jgi:hypothetical protein
MGAGAHEESSVLVEKKAEAPAVPELAAPANAPTLPSPSKAGADAAAGKPTRVTAKRPFMRPAEPKGRTQASPAVSLAEEPMPSPGQPKTEGIEVRPAPPIRYDTDGDARRMYRRSGEIHMVMVTQDPADGCFYEIPLCIPACCTGEPAMSGGMGIFGRGVVEYCWPCGFRAIVKFRHVLGDVRVDYEGD